MKTDSLTKYFNIQKQNINSIISFKYMVEYLSVNLFY